MLVHRFMFPLGMWDRGPSAIRFSSVVRVVSVSCFERASQTRLEQCDHLIWIGLAGMTGWAGLGLLD